MIVNDNTIETEVLGLFFKNQGKILPDQVKSWLRKLRYVPVEF